MAVFAPLAVVACVQHVYFPILQLFEASFFRHLRCKLALAIICQAIATRIRRQDARHGAFSNGIVLRAILHCNAHYMLARRVDCHEPSMRELLVLSLSRVIQGSVTMAFDMYFLMSIDHQLCHLHRISRRIDVPMQILVVSVQILSVDLLADDNIQMRINDLELLHSVVIEHGVVQVLVEMCFGITFGVEDRFVTPRNGTCRNETTVSQCVMILQKRKSEALLVADENNAILLKLGCVADIDFLSIFDHVVGANSDATITVISAPHHLHFDAMNSIDANHL